MDNWNVKNWSAREWISLLGIFAFSVIGTIVQCIYIFKLLKRRDEILKNKYFIVRGNVLFITHCIINFYWSCLHPIIIGVFFLLFPDNIFILITLYCYGLILLDILITIFCIRCWILYFNFNYYALQFEKLWKKKLCDKHYNLSWFDTHKQLGNVSHLLIIGSIITVILCIITIPYAYISELNTLWYLLAGIGIFFVNCFSILIILKLHSRQRIDNFGMRHELTIFILFVLGITIISTIPFMIINDKWIRLWIINLPIHLSTLFVNIFQLKGIQIIEQTNDSNNNENKSEKSYVDYIKLIDILGDSTGINEFARFLIGEFSLEHLLFLIEVSQFRFQFAEEIYTEREELNENIEVEHTTNVNDNKYEYRYKLSSNIPICATIIDNNNNPIKQASIICNKFIKNKSEFQVNISSDKRKEILKTNLNKLTNIELKHIFDLAYNEIFILLELDSFKRYLQTYNANKLAKNILRKKKKKHRHKRAKSMQKERNKIKRERRMRSHSNLKSSPVLTAVNNTTTMVKSISLSTGRSVSISTNTIDISIHSSDNEHSRSDNEPQPSTTCSYDEQQFADPFHGHNINQSIDNSIEKKVHYWLNAASKKINALKCCCEC